MAGEASVRETHIHDLPNECLVDIIRRLGPTDPEGDLPACPPCYRTRDVRQPIRCALVCKHWRPLADTAVSSLNVPLFRNIVEQLGRRFKNLTSLSLSLPATWPEDRIISLARSTPQLESLHIEGALQPASFPAIAAALSAWTSLRTLSLKPCLSLRTDDDIGAVLCALCKLPALAHLSFMVETNLEWVCEFLGEMSGLSTLELTCPAVPPVTPGRFSQILQSLVLRDLQLIKLPNTLGLLRGLKTLSVVSAPWLAKLPDCLSQLFRLTKLEVAWCSSLASLPHTLENLSSFQVLRVYHCPLLRLSRTLGGLTGLKELDLNLYSVRHLPEDGLSRLTGLETCKISELNHVRRLPESISVFRMLTRLEISSCSSLSALPERLAELSSLEVLSIVDCPTLFSLPATLSSLSNLQHLRICGKHLNAAGEHQRNEEAWRAQDPGCVAIENLPQHLGHLSGLRVDVLH